MKKTLLLAMAAGVLLFSSSAVYAAAITDAEFLFKGVEYTAVSDANRWFAMADGSIVAPWQNNWVEYTAQLTPGNWNIGLNVINEWGELYSGWNYEFVVEVNGMVATTFSIPGSDTEVFNGYFNIDITTQRLYAVRYTWRNDCYAVVNGQTYDANMRIVSAFFQDLPPTTAPVPEPSTLLLLGGGLLGLGLFRKRRKST